MTDRIDPHISIQKVTPADDHHQYVIKEYSDFGGFKDVVTPLKAMDMNGLTDDTKGFYTTKSPVMLIERSFCVDGAGKWNKISEIIEDDLNDTKKFTELLKLKPTACKELPNVMAFPSIAFSSNPFKERILVWPDKKRGLKGKKRFHVKKYPALDKRHFETFLQNLYAYSEGMVFVPDIVMRKVQNVSHRVPRTAVTCTVDDYLRIVDDFTAILSARNKKPIFWPIQPTSTSKAIDKILNHYKKNGYSNIWIDFTGGEVYHGRLAGLRSILSNLNATFGKNGYVVYYSHLKKEITSQPTDVTAPASDMLSQFVEADIVGTNRTKRGGPRDEDDIEKDMKRYGVSERKDLYKKMQLNRSRIFDPDSYYYFYPAKHPKHTIFEKLGISDTDLLEPEYNKAIDNSMKFQEIENVKRICQEQKKVKPYMKKRKMFIEKKDVYDQIFEKPSQETSLFDFV
jgi:hypothetical protein